MMMTRDREPTSMPKSHVKANTVIRDFSEITLPNSHNCICFEQVIIESVDGRMLDILDVEICRTVSLWMFLLALFFSSLYFFASFDLGTVQMAST